MPVTRRYAAGPVSTEAAATDPVPAGPALGGPIGGWPGSRCRARPGGGHVMRRNPCSSHGRPPSGPPDTEGTVLICTCASWPPGTASWGFNSVLWGFNSVARSLGRFRRRCGRLPAAAGGCRRAVLMREPRHAAAAVRPWPGARPGCCLRRFRSSHARTGRRAGLPPPFACEMPPGALAVLAWSGDRSPVWGCTTDGVQVLGHVKSP